MDEKVKVPAGALQEVRVRLCDNRSNFGRLPGQGLHDRKSRKRPLLVFLDFHLFSLVEIHVEYRKFRYIDDCFARTNVFMT